MSKTPRNTWNTHILARACENKRKNLSLRAFFERTSRLGYALGKGVGTGSKVAELLAFTRPLACKSLCGHNRRVTGRLTDTMSLPPGLDPVSAGRLGLWLLSRRSHRAAQRRIAFPARAWRGELIHRWCALIVPWKVFEYPGCERMLATLLGISHASAHQYLKPSWGNRLPCKHAITLAQYLESRASQCDALAHELRAYAKARDGVLKPR